MENATDEKDTTIDYDNPWYYQGTAFTSADIGEFFGYVYCITNLITGKKYIGRKYFIQKRKPSGGGRRRQSESNWKALNADRKRLGKSSFSREIISLHRTAGKVNYEETRQLFIKNVLEECNENGEEAYYNSNILGRYMKKDYFKTGTMT